MKCICGQQVFRVREGVVWHRQAYMYVRVAHLHIGARRIAGCKYPSLAYDGLS